MADDIDSHFDEERWLFVPGLDGWQMSSYGDLLGPENEFYRGCEIGPQAVRISDHSFGFNGPLARLVVHTFFENFHTPTMEISYLDGDLYNIDVRNIAIYQKRTTKVEPHRIYGRLDGVKIVLDRRSKGQVMINETGKVYTSANAAAKAVGGQAANVYNCLNGNGKSHKGHTFRYV